MTGRVQGPPRSQPPSLPIVLWTLAGIVTCVAMAVVSAHLLVWGATWLTGLFGAWPWLLLAAGLGWVGCAEKRRWER